jgi:O-antigen/teichoic acid export membrane protein
MALLSNELKDNWRLITEASGILLSRLLPKAASSLIFVLIARRLGASLAGSYMIGISFLNLGTLLTSLGTDESSLREIAKAPTSSLVYLINLVVTRAALAVLGYCLLIALVRVMGYALETQEMVLILGAGLLPESIIAATFTVFNANRKVLYMVLIAGLVAFLNLLTVIVAFWTGIPAEAIAILILAGSVVGALSSLFIAYNLAKGIASNFGHSQKGLFSLHFCERLIKESLPLFLLILLVSADSELDILLLSRIQGPEVVGQYGKARTVILLFSLIPQALRMAIYPDMARTYGASSEIFWSRYNHIRLTILILAVPLVIGGWFVSKDLIAFFFGFPSETVVWVFRILLIHLFFNFLYQSSTRLLVVANRPSALSLFLGLSLLLNISINFAVAPHKGALGTAGARSMSSLVYFTLVEFYTARNFPLSKPSVPVCSSLLVILASTVMMVLWLIVLGDIQPWYINIFLSIVAYAGTSGILTLLARRK